MRRMIALGLALLLSGCAVTYRNYRTGATQPWPPRAQTTGWPLSIRVYGGGVFATAPADVTPRALKIWNEEAVQAYRESGLFGSITDAWSPDSWVAEVAFSVREEEKIRGESFVVIVFPFRRSEVRMRTRFRDPDGRSLGVVEASESFRVYLGPYVLPLALFRSTERTLREAVRDLHRATLAQATREGILDVEARAALTREGR